MARMLAHDKIQKAGHGPRSIVGPAVVFVTDARLPPAQLCVLQGPPAHSLCCRGDQHEKLEIALIAAVTKNGITSAPELKSSTIGGAATAMLFLR